MPHLGRRVLRRKGCCGGGCWATRLFFGITHPVWRAMRDIVSKTIGGTHKQLG